MTLSAPVARVVFADNGCRTADNPRGWLTANRVAHARECAERTVAIRGRVVIIADIEGQEFPHPLSYLGDPRCLPPEMVEDAPEITRVFNDRDIAVIGTIRHTGINPYGTQQIPMGDPGDVLLEKFSHAYDRLSWRGAYLDSNRGHGLPGLVPAAAVKRLAATYPDCLFITEWWDRSYSSLPANVADWEHVDLAGNAHLPRGRKVVAIDGDIDSPAGAVKVRRLAQTGNQPVLDVWTAYGFEKSLRLAAAFGKYQRN